MGEENDKYNKRSRDIFTMSPSRLTSRSIRLAIDHKYGWERQKRVLLLFGKW